MSRKGIKVGDSFLCYKKGSNDSIICEVVDIIQPKSLVTGRMYKKEYLVKDKDDNIFKTNERKIILSKVRKKKGTLKDIFESDEWEITEVEKFKDGNVKYKANYGSIKVEEYASLYWFNKLNKEFKKFNPNNIIQS